MFMALALAGGGAAEADDLTPRATYAGVTCGHEGAISRNAMFLPSVAGQVDAAEVEAFSDLVVESKTAEVKEGKRVTGGPWRGFWCVAQHKVKAGKAWLPLVVSGAGEYTGAGGDSLGDGVTFIARPVANKEVAKRRKAGTLAVPAAVDGLAAADENDAVKALRKGLADRASQTALWASTRDDLILVGSAPSEVYVGKKAVSTLAVWNLALAIDGKVASDEVKNSDGQLVWVVANVVATSAKGGPPTTYRGFFIMLADHHEETERDKLPATDTWHLALAHFALIP